jgi:hypothetical protein
MRKAIWKRWEAQVDPNQELPWDERHRLAQRALKAHMAGMRLALAGNKSRLAGENPGLKGTIDSAQPRKPNADAWDAKPQIYKRKGVDTEFFTVGHLAAAMKREPLTIRQWERKGIIPKSTYQRAGRNGSQHGRRRLYTRAQIEGMIQIASEEGLLTNDRREIASTSFKARVLALFRALATRDAGPGDEDRTR